jgi:hypothetical protein
VASHSGRLGRCQAKLEVLQQSASGHHYLEATADTVVPIASVGEYDDQWWQEHAG